MAMSTHFQTLTPVRAGRVARTALINNLKKRSDKKFILVRAPAGYGKTTALQQFRDVLEGENISRIWAALTAGDSDPRRFILGLVDACGDADIELGDFSARCKAENDAASPETLIGEFTERLGSHPRDLVFFIDEYQNAAGAKNDQLLNIFLQQAPKNMRLILAARKEPACGVAKMRLNGELAEFTQSDLAFAAAETHQLFEADGLTPADAENLNAKTEGWPAALGLAKLMIKGGRRSPDFVSSFSGDLPEIANYFAQEIFVALPEDAQNFLGDTSLFSWFDADLADDVFSRGDSEQMLRRVEKLDAFIIPDEPPRGRYRHHRLFADYLRSHLYAIRSAKEIRALHGRASDYFNRSGDLQLALEHAIDAGDQDRIVAILDKPEFGLFWLAVDFISFIRVMRYIDRNFPEKTFRLLPAYAFYLIKAGRFEEANNTLKLADGKAGAQKKPRGGDTANYARLDRFLVNAIYQVYTDEHQSEALTRKLEDARWQGDIANAMYLGILNNALGMLYFREGRIEDADLGFELSIGHFSEAQSHFGIVNNCAHRGMISILKGDMRAAWGFYTETRRLHRQHLSDDATLSAIIDVNGAELLYQAGRLDEARKIFGGARAKIVSSGDYWVELLSAAFRIEARLEYASKGLDAAFELLGQGIALAQKHKFERLERSLVAQKIHLATAANDLKSAESIAKWTHYKLNVLEYGPLPRFCWRDDAEQAFALIRLDIARGRAPLALSALDRFDKNFQPANLKWIEFKSGTLRALALFANGQTQEAAVLLRELIETGEERGMQSFYLEEGLLAQDLLDEAARRFSKTKRAEAFNETMLQWLIASSSYLPPDKRLTSPDLTPQQLKILKLLAEGCDRNEIADRAETTTHNVQYHLKRMFELFGVTSSMRLVAEATRLKLVEREAAPVLEADGRSGALLDQQ